MKVAAKTMRTEGASVHGHLRQRVRLNKPRGESRRAEANASSCGCSNGNAGGRCGAGGPITLTVTLMGRRSDRRWFLSEVYHI